MSGSESPLKIPVFRRAWLSSVLTYSGLLIQGVGVAWVMVEIAPRDAMVAWVQGATSLPLMLLSIPAGAIADLYNRKRVALTGLLIALAGAFALFAVTFYGFVTPWLLLLFCFVTGSGMALYDPAWQASVPSLVPRDRLPQAIALRSISQNLARAFGPALGGLLVAWKGGIAAFLFTVVFYVPLIVVLFLLKYPHVTPRLPPERIDKATITGIRFVKNSPSTRIVVLRGFIAGFLGVGLLALMPLAVKYNLGGGAVQYGVMLGVFGVGAVAGAALMSRLRHSWKSEVLVSASMVAIGVGAFAMAFISHLAIVSLFLVFSGMGWLILFSSLNISVQTIAPRWVMGRSVATYAAATTGGMVLGSYIWGEAVQAFGIVYALSAVGVCSAGASFIGNWLRLPEHILPTTEVESAQVDIPMAVKVNYRNGPITIEKKYRVDPDRVRPFHGVMQKLGRQRKRNGAYNWSLSRDITDDRVWIERFHFSTWLDFLRLNERSTERDQTTWKEVDSFLQPGTEVETSYQLERPVGSVRGQTDDADTDLSGIPQISTH